MNLHCLNYEDMSSVPIIPNVLIMLVCKLVKCPCNPPKPTHTHTHRQTDTNTHTHTHTPNAAHTLTSVAIVTERRPKSLKSHIFARMRDRKLLGLKITSV